MTLATVRGECYSCPIKPVIPALSACSKGDFIMSSQSQIEANRANAQRSTGPRTEAGKAASSLNAATHGLCSRNVFLPGENPEDWQKIHDNFRAHFQLEDSVIEDAFLDQATHANWKLLRIEEWTTMLVASAFQLEPVPAPIAVLFATDHQTAMRRLERYEASARASLNRALSYLRAGAAQREKARAEAREQARQAEEAAQGVAKVAQDSTQPAKEAVKTAQNKTNPIPNTAAPSQTAGDTLPAAAQPDNFPNSQ
jgi:hypothetical protein